TLSDQGVRSAADRRQLEVHHETVYFRMDQLRHQSCRMADVGEGAGPGVDRGHRPRFIDLNDLYSLRALHKYKERRDSQQGYQYGFHIASFFFGMPYGASRVCVRAEPP